VDIVLGVSVAPDTVRLVVIEGQNADGVTVDQDEFEVADDAVERVVAAIGGTREGAADGGYQLATTGITWTDPATAGALRDAIAAHDVGSVMLVSPLLAAAALAQTVGAALGYRHIAMLFVEPEAATLAVVDVGDGSIVDLHRHQVAAAEAGAQAAQLATMVAALDARGSGADGVFLVGCGADIVGLKPALEAATSLLLTAPEEPDLALARGAALASANAPLFASTTAALAYALDPGTGEMNPRQLAPAYLDVWGNADVTAGALAYSAVDDEDQHAPGVDRRRRASGVLAGVAAVAAAAALVSLSSDRPAIPAPHRPSVTAASPVSQLPAAAPSAPPQVLVPAPSPPPPPRTEEAAPPPLPPAPRARDRRSARHQVAAAEAETTTP
ncbi:hypothetical protein A5700_20615, partial [Mycobacterium sp. E1214]|uniref:DUF7159 family protein n=1 Tax=Mycobacterium sp. E1214 TaxID=1834123 RepID=UPI0007FB7D6F